MSQVVTSENSAEFYASRLPQEAEKPPVQETTTEADDKQDKTEGKEKPKKPLQPRINELVAERNQARDEASELRREMDELRAKLEVMNVTAPLEQNPRPTRAQFQTDDDYNEALSDWKADQRLIEKERKDAEARQKALQAQVLESWKTGLEEIRKEIEDYDAVVGESEVNLPGHLYDALVEAGADGARTAYYLAKNPAEARRLIAMSRSASLRELGKLEIRVTGKTVQVLPEKSKAPAPIEPLKGSSSVGEKDPAKMSYQEWKAARQAGHIK